MSTTTPKETIRNIVRTSSGEDYLFEFEQVHKVAISTLTKLTLVPAQKSRIAIAETIFGISFVATDPYGVNSEDEESLTITVLAKLLNKIENFIANGEAYKKATALVGNKDTVFDFGVALHHLKNGKRVARSGWNGKGMWLSFTQAIPNLPADQFWSEANREYAQRNGGFATVNPCINMRTADGYIQPGWLASQTDMLATDWVLVED